MMVSRPSRLRWFAVMILGQHLGTSGASTCSSITVSGVGVLDLDGTYEKGFFAGDPYVRAGGTTFYEIYEFSDDVGGWYIAVGSDVVYRVYDSARHPVDITLEWVECDGYYACNEGAAVLQPVITCEGVTSASEPEPSTCSSITVSGVGGLDGTYEEGASAGDPFYRAGGTTFYHIYQFSDDVGGWYIAVGNDVVYRVYDSARHPVDTTLEWVECDGYYACNEGAAVLQPVITCESLTSTSEPEPSTCSSITVSGAGGLDGNYEKGYYDGDPFYRDGGITFYEIYQFSSDEIGGWYIAVGNEVVYRVYDSALHPADTTLEWVECNGYYDCNDGAAVLQPVIICEGPTSIPEPELSTCSNITVSGVGDLEGTYEGSCYTFLRAQGTISVYRFLESGSYGWYITVDGGVVYRIYDSALHPADITLEWVECNGSNDCFAEPALLQPIITCEAPAPGTTAANSSSQATSVFDSCSAAGMATPPYAAVMTTAAAVAAGVWSIAQRFVRPGS